MVTEQVEVSGQLSEFSWIQTHHPEKEVQNEVEPNLSLLPCSSVGTEMGTIKAIVEMTNGPHL
jgi:hypothetical protein